MSSLEGRTLYFGKSNIHGWGLFAKRAIKEGELVTEYRGKHHNFGEPTNQRRKEEMG